MEFFKQGMKGPTRPAPSVPALGVNRYSPVTNWDNDPFGDVFEPQTQFAQKKKPPPRPPPPKFNTKQPDIPAKPSHFIRKQTVLSSLLTRKTKTTVNQNIHANQQNLVMDFNCDVDTTRMFPKCEPKCVQMGALIDLSSPPSSPTFTTRSSSDGLSVDSFGSDATTSTNHHNAHNGGNASQAESGFEDDFDLFLNPRKILNKEDTLDDFTAIDPFSPQAVNNKPSFVKKNLKNKDMFDMPNCVSQTAVTSLKGPTIIRAKPARPKPPENSALLKNTFGNSFPVTSMNVNTTTIPIQKVNNGFGDSFESKPFSWNEEGSPEREFSPPMPTIPPPPPPRVIDDDLPIAWPDDETDEPDLAADVTDNEEPCAVALFDYFTDHSDDLCFSANSKIKLIRRIDDEWLYGSLGSGTEGIFPSNYVEIKVPLANEGAPAPEQTAARDALGVGTAVALYDFEPVQPGDLRFLTSDTITILSKINDEWYYGECNDNKGQFPINYVQMS